MGKKQGKETSSISCTPVNSPSPSLKWNFQPPELQNVSSKVESFKKAMIHYIPTEDKEGEKEKEDPKEKENPKAEEKENNPRKEEVMKKETRMKEDKEKEEDRENEKDDES